MFPFEEETEEEIVEEETEEYYPREYEIDFQTGKLTGKIAEGAKALAMWAYLAIHTERYNFFQYSWNYGCEINELIGQQYSDEYTKAEVERMIAECLEVNPYITEIEDLEVSKEKDKLHIKFTIITDYGEEEIETDV